MEILYICPSCNGTTDNGNPEDPNSCAACHGLGTIKANFLITDLDDLKKTVDDIMDKCNDIADAVEALE